MKIQKSGFVPLQKIDNKAVKKEAHSVKDGVVLGSTGQDLDFLKLGDVSGLTASNGPNFANLNLESVPYILGGATLAASLVGISGVPTKFTLFAAGGGAFIGGCMKNFPIAAKITGVGAIIGGGLGAFASSPVGPIIGGLVGGTIGAIVGSIQQDIHGGR